MKCCDSCTYNGEGVMGDHCGRCVKQNDMPTQYRSNDEMERLSDQISDREKMITWALQKISTLKKEIDALRTQDGSCETCRWMNEDETGPHCQNCVHNAKDNYQPMTNHDRLRTMDKRSLAEWLDRTGICIEDKCPLWDVEGCEGQCADRIEEWLSKPIESQRSESNAAF